MLAETRATTTGREVRHAGGSPVFRRTSGRVAYACWLTGDTLVLAGWYADVRPDDADGEAEAHLRRLSPHHIEFPHPRGEDDAGASAGPGTPPADAVGFLAVTHEPDPLQPTLVNIGGRHVLLDPERLEIVDVQMLAWLALSDVGHATRAAAAALLATAQPFGTAPSEAMALAVELARFSEAVREHPSHCRIAVEERLGLFVDAIYRIDERSFYIRGWMRDVGGEVMQLTVIAPEGARAELLGGLVRYPRTDVEQFYGAPPEEQAAARSGFVAYFELEAPSHLAEGWVIDFSVAGGETLEVVTPPVVDDIAAAQAMVMADLVHEVPGEQTLVRDHAFPALSKLQSRRCLSGGIEAIRQYGTPPANPEVTVVVPLYQRIDFVEHQMAQWVNDPDLAVADIIYVLDSPELVEGLAASAAQLHRLYGVAFRTVVLRRNVGFAYANNAGVSIARGRLLLLLNSDVLPDQPGWLSTMVDFYDRTPKVGAVGPKLIYEDESIQHAGMYFVRAEGALSWENAHYFKGLHRRFPPADERRIVPAVTGACLLMSLELWHRVGGLKGTYVQGDYEDSDLCLRLAGLGYDSWYLPEAELYHLEGQSYPTSLRRVTSRFNTWLHTYLWDSSIAAVMQRHSGGPPEPSPSHPSANGRS